MSSSSIRRPHGALVLVLGLAVSTVACAASPSTDEAESNDSDLTGVTDLSEMESALGLWKDHKLPNGQWSRSDAKLEAGACYKKLIGGPDGASYQLRRYSNGASFFKKLGAGAASGDERPILCVDIDYARWNGTTTVAATTSLDDFEIDSVVRYRLGAPEGSDGAAGSMYNLFIGGGIHYSNFWCYGDGPTFQFDPTSEAEVGRRCLSGMTFPGSGGEIDGAALLTVYRFARLKSVEDNKFSYASDHVGRFIKVTGTWDTPEQVIAFENADLHIVRSSETETKYQLTPHNAPAAQWFYECATHQTGETTLTSCGGN
jgi:hypothetical protein